MGEASVVAQHCTLRQCKYSVEPQAGIANVNCRELSHQIFQFFLGNDKVSKKEAARPNMSAGATCTLTKGGMVNRMKSLVMVVHDCNYA